MQLHADDERDHGEYVGEADACAIEAQVADVTLRVIHAQRHERDDRGQRDGPVQRLVAHLQHAVDAREDGHAGERAGAGQRQAEAAVHGLAVVAHGRHRNRGAEGEAVKRVLEVVR